MGGEFFLSLSHTESGESEDSVLATCGRLVVEALILALMVNMIAMADEVDCESANHSQHKNATDSPHDDPGSVVTCSRSRGIKGSEMFDEGWAVLAELQAYDLCANPRRTLLCLS